MTTLTYAWSLLADPRALFQQLEQKPRWLAALALLLLSNLALWLWYYQVVDFGWLKQLLIDSNPDLTSASERAQAAEFLKQPTLLRMTLLSILLGMPVVLLLASTYYSLMGKLMNLDKPFATWFSFVIWTTLPSLLLIPIMVAAVLLQGDGRISPEQMNLLSMNELLWQGRAEAPYKQLLDSINLTTFLSVALSTFGLRVWSQRPLASCLLIAVLPSLLIYGGWLLLCLE